MTVPGYSKYSSLTPRPRSRLHTPSSRHEVEPRPDSDNPTWTEQDREELSRIDHFRFQATKLVVSFNSYGEQTDQQGRVYDMPRDLSTTDKLLFFEGLDWQ